MTTTSAAGARQSSPARTRQSGLGRYASQRRLTWVLFLLPALLVYVGFMAVPLINSLGLSFYQGSGLRPDTFVGLQNYVDLFTDPFWRGRFFNALRNTVVFFAVHMLVQNTLGLLFATLLATGIRGTSTLRTIIFIPATLSVLVIGFLWRLILNPQWGAVNQLLKAVGLKQWALPWLGEPGLALIIISLVSSWQWVGLPTMMFLAGLLGIVSILTFVGNFNAFDIVYAMASARGDPKYSTDIMGTFFYRTAIAGEHPVAQPNMGIGAAVATTIFFILLVGVSFWLASSRQREYEL